MAHSSGEEEGRYIELFLILHCAMILAICILAMALW
jgi:hypothetical protein